MSDTNSRYGPGGVVARLAALALAAPFAVGCVSTTVITNDAVSARKSVEELPEEQLLNVGITVFDDGLEDLPAGAPVAEDDDSQVSRPVRSAEVRYMPFQLRETLQRTGYWGAVRVIPGPSNSVDLTVNGTILHSDGERLKLRVQAVDATGRVWLDRDYDRLAGQLSYRESLTYRAEEPFQDLYDEIANDLAAALTATPEEERVAIRQVSELRFAADLAPDAFGDYLAQEDGRYVIRRLPAYSDPMVARMRRIREREYLFFDTLDDYYEGFADDMEAPYSEWRKYTYDEVIALRELRRQAWAHMLAGTAMIAGGIVANSDSNLGRLGEFTAIAAGGSALMVGIDQRRQSKLHATALEELNDSFEAEVEPLVMEIEGQTVTLQGSLDRQFDEWRGILRDIYALETGPIASSGESAGDAVIDREPSGTR